MMNVTGNYKYRQFEKAVGAYLTMASVKAATATDTTTTSNSSSSTSSGKSDDAYTHVFRLIELHSLFGAVQNRQVNIDIYNNLIS
jgi:hypothetical protein